MRRLLTISFEGGVGVNEHGYPHTLEIISIMTDGSRGAFGCTPRIVVFISIFSGEPEVNCRRDAPAAGDKKTVEGCC